LRPRSGAVSADRRPVWSSRWWPSSTPGSCWRNHSSSAWCWSSIPLRDSW